VTDPEEPLQDPIVPASITEEEVSDSDPTLMGEIIALNSLLSEQLPEMRESIERLERVSVTRDESRKRTKVAVVSVLVATILGILGSMAVTLGVVVPQCFFTGTKIGGPSYCSAIPHYDKTINQEKQSRALFNKEVTILNTTVKNLTTEIATARTRQQVNGPRLDRVESEIQVIEKKLGIPIVKPLPKPSK
jgi:hypothetical protein